MYSPDPAGVAGPPPFSPPDATPAPDPSASAAGPPCHVLTDAVEIREHVAAVMDGRLPRYLFATDFPEGRDALRGFVAGAAILAGVPADAMTYAEVDVIETAAARTTHATVLTVRKDVLPRPVVVAFLALAFGHAGPVGPEQDLIMLGRDGLHLAGLLDGIRKARPVTVGAN